MRSKSKCMISVIAVFALTFTFGCGQNSLESLPVLDTGSQNDGSGDTDPNSPTTPTNPPESYQKLELAGIVGGGSYEDLTVLNLDKTHGRFSFKLPLNVALAEATYQTTLSKLLIETTKVQTSKSDVSVQLPLQYLYADLSKLPSKGLPNGNALPMMPDSQLPSLSLALSSTEKVHLYFGSGSFGYFLESTSIPASVQMTAPIQNTARTRTIGYFTVIPKSGSNPGGLFIALILPSDIGLIIQEYLEYLNY